MSEENDASAEELPPFKIEAARSSRSKCRTCRRAIPKDKLRLGILLEGPYGTGYLWHHLTCAAKRRFEDVEAAYEERAWPEDLDVPPLEELRGLREKAEKARAEKREPPWAERAPTGRSKCKSCGEPIAEGAFRVVLTREVEFGRQIRRSPVKVHPSCVRAELMAEDCGTEAEGFSELLLERSRDLDRAEVEECLTAIGDLD